MVVLLRSVAEAKTNRDGFQIIFQIRQDTRLKDQKKSGRTLVNAPRLVCCCGGANYISSQLVGM